jgi:hypothetical protein
MLKTVKGTSDNDEVAAIADQRVRHVDARGAFEVVRLADGGVAVVCRTCGGSMRLHLGRNLAADMRHESDCAVGAVIAEAARRKAVLLASRGFAAN